MTPSTPSIGHCYALSSKLDDFFAEGLDNRYARHLKTNKMVHDWAAKHGFTLFPEKGFESVSLTCISNGARPGGRTMDPLWFDASRLGLDDLALLRPTNPGQLILGRMNINAFDARLMLAKERGGNWALAKLMLKYYTDYPWRRRTRRERGSCVAVHH